MAAAGLALGYAGWSVRNRVVEVLPRADRPVSPLGETELRELVALAAVLFPPEDAGEARELEEWVRWWAQGRSARGPALETYRAGLVVLVRASGGTRGRSSFAALDHADRAAVVSELMARGASQPFLALAEELIHGIYVSAPGWRSLGYVTWPGVASPPLEYTRRPGPAARVSAATASSGMRG